MKSNKDIRFGKFFRLSCIMLSLFLSFGSLTARGQAGFSLVIFVGGDPQSIVVCQGSGATGIDSLLSVYDGGSTATVDWYAETAPSHGTLSITGSSSMSTGGLGGIVTTSGWSYTPSASYTGSDVFTMVAYNGPDTSRTTILVTVSPPGTAGAIIGPTAVCTGGSVTLSCTPAGGTWSAANSTATVTSSGVVSGVSAGTNTISYAIANSCGSDTATMSLSVVAAPTVPTVSLSGPTSFCTGGSITMSIPSTSGYTYQWYNGTGAISGATNVSYTTSSADNYYIICTNSIGCSSTSATTSIVVNPLPNATITPGGSTTFCTGGSVSLNAAVVSGYAYQWLNGGAAITGATNSTYTATIAGNYTVHITNTTTGCIDSTSTATTVTVNPIPSAAVSVAGALSFCPGGSVVFTGTGGTGYSWQWYNGASALSGATDANYIATTTGNYRLMVTNSYACSATSSTYTVSVYAAPTAAISPTGAVPICYGDVATLTAASGTGYSYQWYAGTTALSGETNSTYAASTPGSYKVRVTNTSGCGSTSAVTNVVNSGPAASISASGSTTFCSGSVSLIATTGTGYSWQWYNGTTVLAGATSGSYTTSTTGSYKVLVSDASGCATLSSPIAVTNLGVPYIIASGDTVFCQGNNVLLTVNTAGVSAGTSVYQWKKNSINIAGATNSNYTATTTGFYTCYENIGGTCIATTPALELNVHPTPVPVISFVSGALSTAASYSSYQWKFNGTVIPGATSRTTTSLGNGNYTVKVTDAFGCEGSSATFTVSPTGVNEVKNIKNVTLYPNPAKNTLNVESSVNVKLVISSIDGKAVATYEEAKEIDISAIPNGIYIVTVFDENGNRLIVEKLIKE